MQLRLPFFTCLLTVLFPAFMHKNNFDFLRLMFAVFVVVSHSGELLGSFNTDWLALLTKGQVKLSYLGVRGFFVISGFLIFESVARSKTFFGFYWKRVLRLFPALVVVLLITVLLLPFVYEGTLPYLKNKDVWTYVPNNLTLFKLQPAVDGVFHNREINGSLWTIKYEFLMYIFLSLFFFVKKYARVALVVSFAYLSFCHVIGKTWLLNIDGNYFNLAFFFIGGALCGSFKQELARYKRILLLAGSLIFVVSLYFSFFSLVQFFILPIIIIPIGISSTKNINSIGSVVGDLSYGIYISSYPIQQTLVHFFRIKPYELFIATIVLSAAYAYASWHLIEKKALELKQFRFSYARETPVTSLMK